MLTAGDATQDERFGWQILLGDDLALISDDGDDADATDNGAVYRFELDGTWSQVDKILSGEPAGDAEFGGSIAWMGTTLLIGSPGRLGDTGAVYAFSDADLPTTVPTENPTDAPTDAATDAPTDAATANPTDAATDAPTSAATDAPTDAATTAATPTATEITGVELLTNGSFEVDTDPADNIPDGWLVKNRTGDKRKCGTVDKVIAFDGDCVYQFKGSTGENSKLLQSIDAAALADAPAAGDVLDLSGTYLTKGTGVKAKVKVTVTYTDSGLEPEKLIVKQIAAADFTPITGSVTLAGSPAIIKVQMQNKATTGKIRYDALSLVVLPPAAASGGAIPLS